MKGNIKLTSKSITKGIIKFKMNNLIDSGMTERKPKKRVVKANPAKIGNITAKYMNLALSKYCFFNLRMG